MVLSRAKHLRARRKRLHCRLGCYDLFHLVQKPSFINRSRKKGGAKNFPGFQELFKAVLYMGESKIHCNSLACAEIAGHSGQN